MAIVATLIGGFFGFMTFLCSLIFFDASFLTALNLYIAVGAGVALSLIAMMAGVRHVISELETQAPILAHPARASIEHS